MQRYKKETEKKGNKNKNNIPKNKHRKRGKKDKYTKNGKYTETQKVFFLKKMNTQKQV